MAIIDSNDGSNVASNDVGHASHAREKLDGVMTNDSPSSSANSVMIDTVLLPENPRPEERLEVEGGVDLDPAAIIDSNDISGTDNVPTRTDPAAIIE